MTSARERTRLFIVTEGRSIRRIQRLGPDNVVLSEIRHMLLGGGACRETRQVAQTSSIPSSVVMAWPVSSTRSPRTTHLTNPPRADA